jgi:large subunit ribosomal protein L17
LISGILLTEREVVEGLDPNAPKTPGRIITTIEKAKEIRPLLERCVTIAKKGLAAEAAAEQFAPSNTDRKSEEWKSWRKSDNWKKWADARSPGVTARRRVLAIIRNKQAVGLLFEKVAPRFADRNGGYTRILRLAKPRLGDNGTRAILEFVGKADRVSKKKAQKPQFAGASESGSAE